MFVVLGTFFPLRGIEGGCYWVQRRISQKGGDFGLLGHAPLGGGGTIRSREIYFPAKVLCVPGTDSHGKGAGGF